MKNKIIYIIVIVIFLMFVIPLINFLQDDYGVFNRKYKNIYSSSYLKNEQCLKLHYVTGKDSPKYNSFIFGSSDVGIISPLFFEDSNSWYNLASRAVNPYDLIPTLEYLKQHNVEVKNVLYGVKPTMFFADKDYLRGEKNSHYMLYGFPFKKMETINFYLHYLFLLPFRHVNKNVHFIYEKNINMLKTGSYTAKKDILIDYNKNIEKLEKTAYMTMPEYKKFQTDIIEEFNRIKEYCEDNKINLKLFIFPDYIEMYKMYNSNDLKIFKEKLSEVISYYDFSGENEITINPKYYINIDHCSAYTCNLIVKRIYEEDKNNPPKIKGFGEYIQQKENINED